MTKHLTHFIKHNYHPETRHTGAGRYPLQATQPPQKRAVQKIPLSAGGGKKHLAIQRKKIHQLGGWANMHRRKSGNTQCNIKTQPPS